MTRVRPSVSLGEGVCIKETDMAILFAPDNESEFWVPKSVISDDSDVSGEGMTGELMVSEWWAEKEGRV